MSASSDGFAVVRRGYRPEQVDRRIAGLIAEREAAAGREEELSGRVEGLRAEADELWATVAALPPQDYAELGKGAQQLRALAEEEAAELRAAAETEARQRTEEARETARGLRERAAAEAERLRAEADSAGESRVEAARNEAGTLRAEALHEAGETREKAATTLKEMARRCSALLSGQEQEHAAESEALDRDLAEQERVLGERIAGLEARGEKLLKEAQRAYAEAGESARHSDEDAQARAREVLAEARMREESVGRESERTLQEHEERAEELRRHMAHVRAGLAALTGRVEPGPEGE